MTFHTIEWCYIIQIQVYDIVAMNDGVKYLISFILSVLHSVTALGIVIWRMEAVQSSFA
jgi:hypothetical protein